MPEQHNASQTQFIANKFGDELLYEVNRHTFDLLGSSALYKRHFGEQLHREDTLYIVIGTDSGLLPTWILEKGCPPGSRYVFVELPELIEPIESQCSAFGEHAEHVALRTVENWGELAREFQFQDYAYLDRIAVVHSLGALDAFLPEYHAVRFAVEGEVESFNRHIKLSMGNHVFIRRHIENIPDNLFPISRLRGGFEDYTAVLLGGGPSLDDVLPWVRQNRDRLVVIAVSRIARQLRAAGIQPDMVASIDPHQVSYDISKEMLEFDRDCLFVNSFHVVPLLLRQWRGPAVYWGNHYPWRSQREPRRLPNPGPTVSHMALATAIEMGFPTIVLGGVDLCYTREGHTYASGSNERRLGPNLGKVGLQVETNSGEMADTSHAFMQGVTTLGQIAAQAAMAGRRVINPAPHAARVHSVDHVALDSIDLKAPPIPFRDKLKGKLGDTDLDTRREALNEIRQELAYANGQLRKVIEACDEAVECNQRLFGRDGGEPDFKHKKRMDKIERRLDREYAKFSHLVKEFAAPLFLRLSRPDKDKDWTDAELERFGEGYYRAYRKGATDLLHLVEGAQQMTLSRLDELDSDVPLVGLYKRWQADRTPGRHRLWRQWHPDYRKTLSAEDLELLDLAEEIFQKTLRQETGLHEKHLKRIHNFGLGPVRGKLLAMLNTGNSAEIERLAEQTATMEGDEAGDLTDLANAYLAELAENTDLAVEYYNRILDRASTKLDTQEGALQNPRLEDALRRLSHITLHAGDQQNALVVLSILSQISPTYETQYADLLRMTGNAAQAIDVYTDYLQKVPADILTMLKLGRLYQEIGALDSARSAYDHVLEQSPDNQAAQRMRASLEAVQTSP